MIRILHFFALFRKINQRFLWSFVRELWMIKGCPLLTDDINDHHQYLTLWERIFLISVDVEHYSSIYTRFTVSSLSPYCPKLALCPIVDENEIKSVFYSSYPLSPIYSAPARKVTQIYTVSNEIFRRKGTQTSHCTFTHILHTHTTTYLVQCVGKQLNSINSSIS